MGSRSGRKAPDSLHRLFLEFIEGLAVRFGASTLQELDESVESPGDGTKLSRSRLPEGFKQRVKREFRHPSVEELADRGRRDQERDAAIGGVCLALDQALFFEPVDDA